MKSGDVFVLMPLIIIAAAAVLIMFSSAVKRNHMVSFILSLIGLAAAFVYLFITREPAAHNISTLLIIDDYSRYYMGLLFAATFVIVLLSYNYFEKQDENRDEYYILILTATLGSSVLVAASHFATIFLGLEVLSVSLYTMIAYFRKYSLSIEAGLKYLILAAVSSAILLFGMALLYTDLGTMEFALMSERLTASGASPLVITGFALIICGIGFKLAVVPFHMWTPDVYQGASAPVASFIASVSKGGMFALLVRLFTETDAKRFTPLVIAFSVIAAASMIIGNILAVRQNNVKRILAYSSIANLGYLMVAFIAAGAVAVEAGTFYLTSYFIAIIASFGIISILTQNGKEPEDINDYRGLFWRRPFLAAVFTAMLLSLAGIPLTAGFIGKFFIVSAGVNSALWLLTVVLVLSSVIGLYYYLRIITTMFSREEEPSPAAQMLPFAGSLALFGLALLLVWFGVSPAGLLQIIRNAVTGIL